MRSLGRLSRRPLIALLHQQRPLNQAAASVGVLGRTETFKTQSKDPALNVSDSALEFSSSGFVRHVSVPTSYRTADFLQIIEDSLPHNATLTAKELVELGSVWYLPVGAPRTPSPGVRPIRLDTSSARNAVSPGDYLRIHFDPRRFPIAYQADWSIPVGPIQGSSQNDNWVEQNHDDTAVIIGQGRGWLVLNKPAGLPCHSTVDNVRENVIGCLRAENPGWSYFTPPQRLDHNTSGLLAVSTNKTFAGFYAQLNSFKTFAALNETCQVDLSAIDKRYRCLVCLSNSSPSLEQGQVLRHFLEPSIRAPKRFVDSSPHGEDWPECLTKVISIRGPFSLLGTSGTKLVNGLWQNGTKPSNCYAVAEVEVELLTGRTHQIRGQLAASGVPIVGDVPYGGARNIHDSIHLEPTDKLALQCYELSFVDPDYLNETSWRLSKRRNRFRLRSAWWTELLPTTTRPELLPPRVQLSVGRHKYVLIQGVDPTGNSAVEWFVKSASPAECGGAHHGKSCDICVVSLLTLAVRTRSTRASRVDPSRGIHSFS